jgi:hypothetical protein
VWVGLCVVRISPRVRAMTGFSDSVGDIFYSFIKIIISVGSNDYFIYPKMRIITFTRGTRTPNKTE